MRAIWAVDGVRSPRPQSDLRDARHGLKKIQYQPGLISGSIRQLAGIYLKQIRAVQPSGPYHLLG